MLEKVSVSDDRIEVESSAKTLDDVMFEEKTKKFSMAFEQQFHYACFYAYLKLKE